jgi:methylmalonyl-CoA/ethylmalonyl-CoA epimerase
MIKLKIKLGVMIMVMNSIQKIGQIGVPVKDLEKAIDFYKEVLGLTLLFKMDSLAFFDCNGVRLLLSLPEKEEFAFASSVIYFQVENIKELYENFLKKGVQFIDEPHMVAKVGQTETWMAFFKDTEDNTHALMSEVQI